MTHTLIVNVPATLWMSANVKMHWAPAATRARNLRKLGYVTARNAKVSDLGPTLVSAFIGYPPTVGRADPANERVTKHLIDGMVDAGVWPDDSSEWVLGPIPLRDTSSGIPTVHTVRLVLTSQTVPF
jgi:crossover junction endodeoxyribonuclease RusA